MCLQVVVTRVPDAQAGSWLEDVEKVKILKVDRTSVNKLPLPIHSSL